MRIGFVVNRLRSLRSTYTTTRLAVSAARTGHQVVFIDVNGFTLDPANRLLATAYQLPAGEHEPEALVEDARRGALPRGVVDLEALDGLVLRNNPVRRTVLDGARGLRVRGVPVFNDPDGLAAGAGKFALGDLPVHLKPRTLITRDADALRAFFRALDGPAVVKPIRGFGGRAVVLLQPDEERRLDAYAERIRETSDGYVVLQEYCPAAERGDKRILLVEGRPVGCYVRMRKEGEFRHNIHVGGQPRPGSLDDADREICAALAGRLHRDGVFLAGLDVIGQRAVEVNVVAPGGVANIERTAGRPIADHFVERLVERMQREGNSTGPGRQEPGWTGTARRR